MIHSAYYVAEAGAVALMTDSERSIKCLLKTMKQEGGVL